MKQTRALQIAALFSSLLMTGCAPKAELPHDISKTELEIRVLASKENSQEAKTLDALASMGKFCVVDEKIFCPNEPYTATFDAKEAVNALARLKGYRYDREAKTIGMKLLPVFDSSPELLIFLGQIYESEYDFRGAELLYTHASHLNPSSVTANSGVARCMLTQKKPRVALRYAKKAREREVLRQKELDDLIEKIQTAIEKEEQNPND